MLSYRSKWDKSYLHFSFSIYTIYAVVEFTEAQTKIIALFQVDSEAVESPDYQLEGQLDLGSKKRRHVHRGQQLNGPPSSEVTYQCDQCDKAFGKPSSLARHKYEHSG